MHYDASYKAPTRDERQIDRRLLAAEFLRLRRELRGSDSAIQPNTYMRSPAFIRVATPSHLLRCAWPKPGSAKEFSRSWNIVRYYETEWTMRNDLPCGTDDAYHEEAVARYSYHLSIVREYGRPLPR